MADLIAFTAENVSRLTGLSIRRLYYWDKIELLTPTFADKNRRQPYGRIYSFRDVVSLRTLSLLRNKHHVPLQELRKANKWLAANYESPWSELRLYVRGKEIIFCDPSTLDLQSALRPGQIAIPIELEEVVHDVRREAEKLRVRTSEQLGRIDRNRFVVHNANVIAGTRVPTSGIWSFYTAGYSVADIIKEYPVLTPTDVHAAIDFESSRQQNQAG